MEFLSSPTLPKGLCADNAASTTKSLFWEARFSETYPELYPAVREVAKPFVGKDALVIMPSSYRSPDFWKDLYNDMHNVRGLPDGGALLGAVEKLMNGEKPKSGESVRELVDSFWPLLVVMLNLDGTYKNLLLLVLKYEPSLLDYANANVINELNDVLDGVSDTESGLFKRLLEDIYLYLLKDSRVVISAACQADILYVSCFKGYLEVLRHLLDVPETDSPLNFNCTFYLAVGLEQGIAEVVRLLLEDGRADPAAKEIDTLYLACSGGHKSVLSLLLKDGRVDPTVAIPVIISNLSREMNLEIVEVLLADPRVRKLSIEDDLLSTACNERDTGLVRLLMKDGRANPTAHNNSAIRVVSRYGDPETARLLLSDRRVDSALVQEAIEWAQETGNSEVARSLLYHPLRPVCSDGKELL